MKKVNILCILLISALAIIPIGNAYAQTTTTTNLALGNWDLAIANEIAINNSDNFTFSINFGGVTTTNETGTHEYVFYVSNANHDGLEIKIASLNRSVNTVTYRLLNNGSDSSVMTTAYNLTSASLIFADGVVSSYAGTTKVYQYTWGGDTMTLLGYSTADVSAGGNLPANFNGYFYISMRQGASPTTLAVNTGELIGLVVVIAMVGIVAGIAKSKKS